MKTVKLPHGFVHNEKLYNIVDLRGITGNEQNYLVNTKLVRKNQHISKILDSCIISFQNEDGDKLESVSNVVDKLLSTDRFFLMVHIRMESLGDKFQFEHSCSKCGKKAAYFQLLSKLETKYSEDLSSTFEITLPSSNKIAKIKLPNGTDEQKLFDIFDKHTDTLITSMLALSIVSIDGEKPTTEDIKNLPILDNQYISDFLEEKQSGIDEWLEFACPECGEEHREPLPAGDISFFSKPLRGNHFIEI